MSEVPKSKYPNWTDCTCKVMQLANQEAQRFNQTEVGTEHILLALLKGSGLAVGVLKAFGFDLQKARRAVEEIVPCGPELVTMGKLPFTSHVVEVIQFAEEEAGRLKDKYIDDEHLLLGLLRASGTARLVFKKCGISTEDVREVIMSILGYPSTPTPQEIKVVSRITKTEVREFNVKTVSVEVGQLEIKTLVNGCFAIKIDGVDQVVC